MKHTDTTNISEARLRLREVAEQLSASGDSATAEAIIDIVDTLMTRRPDSRRASATVKTVAPGIVQAVTTDLKITDLPSEEIARKYKIDDRTVSEIYRTMRT